jgi:hypothetical protein
VRQRRGLRGLRGASQRGRGPEPRNSQSYLAEVLVAACVDVSSQTSRKINGGACLHVRSQSCFISLISQANEHTAPTHTPNSSLRHARTFHLVPEWGSASGVALHGKIVDHKASKDPPSNVNVNCTVCVSRVRKWEKCSFTNVQTQSVGSTCARIFATNQQWFSKTSGLLATCYDKLVWKVLQGVYKMFR